MQVAYESAEQSETSHVTAIPFINLDPRDLSTIYTALSFAVRECNKSNQRSCIVTFYQPLYIKAAQVVASCEAELDIVTVRLGGFHLLMSYMGAVGYIMSGSGLEEVWGLVYAKASVTHMTSGHAYSRALRAQFITQLALGIILLQSCPTLDDSVCDNISSLHAELLSHGTSVYEIIEQTSLAIAVEALEAAYKDAEKATRTGKLWIQYFRQVSLMREYIRAKQSGDWQLHLHCVSLMIPHFHAAGHLQYAKCAHLYLQQLNLLSEKISPDEYQKFDLSGYFTNQTQQSLLEWSLDGYNN